MGDGQTRLLGHPTPVLPSVATKIRYSLLETEEDDTDADSSSRSAPSSRTLGSRLEGEKRQKHRTKWKREKPDEETSGKADYRSACNSTGRDTSGKADYRSACKTRGQEIHGKADYRSACKTRGQETSGKAGTRSACNTRYK